MVRVACGLRTRTFNSIIIIINIIIIIIITKIIIIVIIITMMKRAIGLLRCITRQHRYRSKRWMRFYSVAKKIIYKKNKYYGNIFKLFFLTVYAVREIIIIIRRLRTEHQHNIRHLVAREKNYTISSRLNPSTNARELLLLLYLSSGTHTKK